MGLDMYVYRATKPSAQDIKAINGRKYSDIQSEYSIFTDIHTEEAAECLRDIIPYCQEAKVLMSYYDIDAMKDYLGINRDTYAYISAISYRDGGRYITITIPDEHREEAILEITGNQFSKNELEDVYITHLEKIAYWRKEYALQDELYHLYTRDTGNVILNCGYHNITPSMMKAIRKHDMFNQLKGIRLTKNLFYHEWY